MRTRSAAKWCASIASAISSPISITGPLTSLSQQGPIAVRAEGRDVPRIVATYAEAAAGEVCALFGSTNHLEIAINGGNAASTLGLARGAQVTVVLSR